MEARFGFTDGAIDTGRYREAIPTLLRSDGAIEGA